MHRTQPTDDEGKCASRFISSQQQAIKTPSLSPQDRSPYNSLLLPEWGFIHLSLSASFFPLLLETALGSDGGVAVGPVAGVVIPRRRGGGDGAGEGARPKQLVVC